MATPDYATLEAIALDAMQCNVATDAPFTTAEKLRDFNEAYATMWQIEGGRVTSINHADAWATATIDSTGSLVSDVTDIEEVLFAWVSTTQASIGTTAGDLLLDRVERDEIMWHRNRSLGGTYLVPKLFSIEQISAATGGTHDTTVNRVRLDMYPAVATVNLYLPIRYRATFTPLTNGANDTVPELTDLGARDAALLWAAACAPRAGRAELVPGIMSRVSDRTTQVLERKQRALQSADQEGP